MGDQPGTSASPPTTPFTAEQPPGEVNEQPQEDHPTDEDDDPEPPEPLVPLRILDQAVAPSGEQLWLVKWVGQTRAQATWELTAALREYPQVLEAWVKAHPRDARRAEHRAPRRAARLFSTQHT
eukprot:TRINITY_DN2004_c0_g1_i3.p1 TRINITY_DN2004_c0_g1~~TRINITY_DN2004_c0_g1_i3.p1  ORF type:complete len:124 (+),score=22.07 TRINITY_DN2004_c0_g1_i3:181-552(+)